MTREEAIKALRDVQREVMRDSYIGKVYDMAIEALSREPNEEVASRKVAIDVNGLDEEIRCEMCKNPIRTDRGCDGNCKYDEELYKKITQTIAKRITPLPSAKPYFDITVKIDKAYDDGYEAGYLQGKHDWGDLDE